MKKIHAYLPNVLLTFLLVFAVLGTELTGFVQMAALHPDTYRKIAVQEALGDKAYAALETTFKARSNSTGIPAEVFLDPLSPEQMQAAVQEGFTAGLDYLNGGDYAFAPDLSGMENAVRRFISDYADENGIDKDAAYEERVNAVITEAREEVLFTADTFKFRTLYNNGWLDKGRRYLGYLRPAMHGCGALALVLAILLAVLNRKQLAHLAYWYGLAGLTAGVLLLVPTAYLCGNDYFAGFALKDPQIYAAVVGLLRLLTQDAMCMAGITAGIGVVLLIVFGVLLRKDGKKA